MAMNKKEQAELESAKKEALLMRALRWSDPVKPDIPIPKGSELTKGFLFNAYSAHIEVACSSSVSHAFGRNDRTTSQNPRQLYSTKELALRGMRHEVAMECAIKLARIDEMIAAESK